MGNPLHEGGRPSWMGPSRPLKKGIMEDYEATLVLTRSELEYLIDQTPANGARTLNRKLVEALGRCE